MTVPFAFFYSMPVAMLAAEEKIAAEEKKAEEQK
jgi:hypothetical protein